MGVDYVLKIKINKLKFIFISAMMGVDYILKLKINIYILHDGRGFCTQN